MTNPFSSPPVDTSGQPITITLFGTFQLTVNGHPITNFRSTKARALLAYLLLTRAKPLLRTTVSELLWPGYTDQSALANLRQTLANLRTCLAPYELLQSNRKQLQLINDPIIVRCDVLHFEALLDACQHHPHQAPANCPVCRPRLVEAVALYQGPLLENLPPTESPAFDEWLRSQRAHLATRLAAAQAALAAARSPVGNLPPPLTSLLGRAHELAVLERRLRHTIYRCVTLVGPGGIGKTRLAAALAAHVQADFADGVWLVALGGLPPTTPAETPAQLHDRLAIAIGTTLGLAFYGTLPPATQVANHLADKTALLMLDGFEHLEGAAAWLPTLLTAAPRLRLLITSRHRLLLQSQLVYQVEGLAVPSEKIVSDQGLAEQLAQYSSLHLFVERAESAGLTVRWDRETLATVGRLCRFVEGSPWAIELVVAQLDRQSLTTILAAIQENYRTLTSHLLDVPLRQRSAAAVFHTSWALLAPVEAQTLARCAVFRGGFTLAMAQTIAAATPAVIEALVHKSLLQPSGADRYAMHDLVRQFAGEQLMQDPTAAHDTHAAHAAYFTTLLAAWQPDDATIKSFRVAVTQDWDNVQAAWAWAVAAGMVALLQQGLSGLAEFYNLAELFLEADAVLGRTIERVRLLLNEHTTSGTSAADRRALQTLLAHLLWRHCYFVNDALVDTERAMPLAQELLALAHELNDCALAARGYYELSVVAYFQSDFRRQEQLLRQALPLAQQHGTIYDQFLCLNLLGLSQSNPAAAFPYFQQALALTQAGDYAYYDLLVLNNIGSLQVSTGHFMAAIAHFQAALPRAMTLDFESKIAFIVASLGEIALLVGDYAAALPQLVEAHQRYAALHDHAFEAQLLQMLSMLYAESGEHGTALTYCHRALAAAGGHLYVVQHNALCTLGHLQRHRGQWDAASALYQQALTLSQALNRVSDELRIQTYLAAVTFAQGDGAAALAAVEPLLANFATTPFISQDRPQELLLIAYQILVANADPRAQAVLHQAWAYVQEQAAKIDDPRLRETFLANVPVNRELARVVATQPAFASPQ